ncbi:MAG: tetratricopeptide repeat protein, partial [Bacteroidota bacterium]
MKKLISILFLLVFHVAVKSQSCDKLQELSLYYFQNNKYEESLKYSLEGLDVCKKTYGENSKEYALSCFSAAQIYSTIKDHPSSLNYYFKSEEITKSLGKEFYYMHASILLSIGDTYYSLQSFQNAEKYYIKY